MKRLIWLGMLGLGGCVASPPSYNAPTAMYPVQSDSHLGAPTPFTVPVPGDATAPDAAGPAPLPPPVQASPLPPDSAGQPPAADIAPDAGTAPSADIAPGAQPGDTGNLDDTIARLRGQPSSDTAPPPVAPRPAIASAPPPTPPPITDMTRPGFHDHYGGLNSDGDVPAH